MQLILVFGLVWVDYFVVGVEDVDYVFFMSIDVDGQFCGFVCDLFDLFVCECGYCLEYCLLLMCCLMMEYFVGCVDVVFLDSLNWQVVVKWGWYLGYFEFIVFFQDVVMVLFGQCDWLLYILGIVCGFMFKCFLLQIQFGGLQVSEVGDLLWLICMVLVGCVDGVYVVLLVVCYQFDQFGCFGVLVLFMVLVLVVYEYYYCFLSVGQLELVVDFNCFLCEELVVVVVLQYCYGLDERLFIVWF